MGSKNLLPTLMNRENMKDLFNNDPEIGEFLINITWSFSTSTSEMAHIDIINLFAENNFDVEHMNQYLEKYKNTFLSVHLTNSLNVLYLLLLNNPIVN